MVQHDQLAPAFDQGVVFASRPARGSAAPLNSNGLPRHYLPKQADLRRCGAELPQVLFVGLVVLICPNSAVDFRYLAGESILGEVLVANICQ